MRMNMLTVALPLFFGAPMRATTIVLVSTPSFVVVAADSEITSVDQKVTGTVCKIHVAQNYVWTADGLYTEIGGSFDLEKLVPDALENGVPFPTSIDRLKSRLESAFPGLLRDYITEKHDPDGALVEVVVVDTKIIGQFSTVRISHKSSERTNCPGNAHCGNVIAFGNQRRIKDIMNTKGQEVFRKMGVVAALNYLIGEQEKEPYSGGPIAMIRIDRQGTHWIQKGTCE